MFYILDDSGYIEATSSHFIECKNKTCTEYKGTIPSGYDSLDDWVLNANIRAYKIDSSGNLVFDAGRDATLKTQWAQVGQIEVYSTEEKIIGVWIDGKPLYRKTIYLENVELPANSDGTIYELMLMDLWNIDHIDLSKFHIKAGADSSSIYTTTIMQNTYFSDNNYLYVRGFMTNLLIQTNYWKYIHKGCITIEYTKTTD
jgi:hypothetical protein